MHGESGDASGAGMTQAMIKMPLLIATFIPKDVYNMDERLVYFIVLNQTRLWRKEEFVGVKFKRTMALLLLL
jgi:hypothetical protein